MAFNSITELSRAGVIAGKFRFRFTGPVVPPIVINSLQEQAQFVNDKTGTGFFVNDKLEPNAQFNSNVPQPTHFAFTTNEQAQFNEVQKETGDF